MLKKSRRWVVDVVVSRGRCAWRPVGGARLAGDGPGPGIAARFGTGQWPAASTSGPPAGTMRRIPPTMARLAHPGSTTRGRSWAWMIRASGWIGLIIVLMSFYLIALIVWMAQRYRTTVAVPPELLSEVQNLLEKAKYNDAYHKLLDDPSFLARVLAAGVRKLPSGLSHAQRAMELANEDMTMEMEHRTTYLATVGTLGPMIGLVGTVYGMIMSFRVIAVSGASAQPSELAAGISTALFATLEGIGVSIPAIFFYAFFRNRIARLSLEVGMAAEPLLEQFAPGCG